MKKFQVAALLAIAAVLAVRETSLAQSSGENAPMTAPSVAPASASHTVTVTGLVVTINAGVATLSNGQKVFYDQSTKVSGKPIPGSKVTVTGISVSQGNIQAETVVVAGSNAPAMAAGAAHKTVTVTALVVTINAGVATLGNGQKVFYGASTKVTGHPIPGSKVTVTGTTVSQGNIQADSVVVLGK